MKRKVVLIGTGFVGMSYAYALLNQGVVNELVLIDVNKEKAEGEAMDLNHGLAFAPKKMNIYAGSYEDCHDASLVVISAGVSQKPGQTRLDLLKINAKIMKDITNNIMKSGFNGILLVASNPVDILSYVVWKESKLDKSKVFGSGTSLDTARLRYEISKYINIDSRNVHAYILGEHGDSEFVCWSNAYIGVKPLEDVMKVFPNLTYEALDKIYENVRDAAYEIIARKTSTYYGIGMALVRITRAIFEDENSIIPVSAYVDNEYKNVNDVFIGVPAVINSDGIHHVVSLELCDKENTKMQESYKILRDQLDKIGY